MNCCYAEQLGDCEGQIEDEHFIPVALQHMFGSVGVRGFLWQNGATHQLPPKSYAHGRVICRKHHDALDGLDANARDYFRNLMLVAAGGHITTGKIGEAAELVTPIDGRALELWFLKTICGAIATGNVTSTEGIPSQWLRTLFSIDPWPDPWSISVSAGEFTFQESDASVNFDFVWSNSGQLLGVTFRTFCVTTQFCIVPPDIYSPAMLHRPKGLGFTIDRPSGGSILRDVPRGETISFKFSWPDDATINGP